jgi:GT2 family glycosyltransferase
LTPSELSIIIVSWNVRDLLRRCLMSLVNTNAEIIVVDSASVDGSADMVRAEFPHVQLIASTENLGYSKGNNVGLKAAQGRYLFVLNPDTEVATDAVPQMVTYMDAHPDVGVLGPQLRLADGSIQSSRRRFPTLATGFFESTWFQSLAPRSVLARYYVQEIPDTQIAEVDWLVGAALLVRREAYARVGGFDENFFMYSEELDWCRRIKAAGWRVVYWPQAVVTHYEGRSSEQVPAATHIRFNTSKIRYFRKYHGNFTAECLRWFLLGNFALQWGLEALKGLLGHKKELRAKRVKAYGEVLRSGLRG